MSARVKITVAEPSELIRAGIVVLLKKIHGSNIEIYEVDDVAQVRSALGWQQPDILLVNPTLLGLFSVAQMRKEVSGSELKVVALQTVLIDQSVLKCYDEVISVNDSSDTIREKITRLTDGADEDRRHESLSQREKEVVACVVQGMTNKQIADRLCLSTHTVITHRRNISAKLGIHSTAGLTIYAIVNKLVDLNEIKNTPNPE